MSSCLYPRVGPNLPSRAKLERLSQNHFLVLKIGDLSFCGMLWRPLLAVLKANAFVTASYLQQGKAWSVPKWNPTLRLMHYASEASKTTIKSFLVQAQFIFNTF
jgi:hypothetical protein